MAQKNDQELIPLRLGGLYHGAAHQLALYFDNYGSLNNFIRKAGARWTRTNHCWIIALNKTNYEAIMAVCKGKATVNRDALNVYMRQQGLVNSGNGTASSNSITTASLSEAEKKQAERTKRFSVLPQTPPDLLSAANKTCWEQMRLHLVLAYLSSSTIKTYLNEFTQLLKILKEKCADSLTEADLKRYMAYLIEKQGISPNTAHSRLNAMKYYYEQVLKREKFFYDLPRPKRGIILPKILNEDELRRMFAAVTNTKHKAILFTAYGAGLRVSEVCRLKLADIDSGRMQIRIAASKGDKDRYVGLGVLTLDILRAYLRKEKIKPEVFVFEGGNAGVPYSCRSAQAVFHSARNNAGIKKELSFHSLRHSFATHLLEKGIDIRYIKDILGHFDIRTTERYLHVKREQLVAIVNPLDILYKNEPFDS